jgi:NAD(P)H dehydrogenase (quinone)
VKVLVVSAHPSHTSYLSSLRDAVLAELADCGHQVRHHDLYAESFDPVFTSYERTNHVGDLSMKLHQLPELAPYVESLQWCNALVMVYPTWWGSPPAIVKGWIDRVFMNGVAWVLPDGAVRIKPLLTNIQKFAVITTHGSSKVINAIQGESGKRITMRSIRLMFHPRVKTKWFGIYKLDRMKDSNRERHLKRAIKSLRQQFR